MQKRLNRFLVVTLLYLGILSLGYGQSLRLKFDHIGTAEGLPQNTIHGIAKDKYGFMWFGTWAGLCRYDGYRMRVYRYNPKNPKSIINNRIHNILMDNQQDIWIQTLDDTFVCKYNYERDNFDRIPVSDVDTSMLIKLNHREHIQNLYPTYQDYQWHIQTSTSSLIQTHLPTSSKYTYTHNPFDPWSLNDQQVSDLYLDDNDILWVGTYNNGLNKASLHPHVDYWYHEPNHANSISDPAIRSICEDQEGNIWMGTRSSGVSVRKKDGTFFHFQHDPSNPNSLASNYVHKVFCDSKGMIWVGTRKGLHRIDPKSRQVQRWQDYDLDYIRVTEIIEDKQQRLWFATHRGIYSYDLQLEQFTHYDPLRYQQTRYVSTIMLDSKNQIWSGNDTEGIYVLKENNTQGLDVVHHFTHDSSSVNSINDNRVICLLEDAQKNIWIGTSNGLNRYDPKQKNFTRFSGRPDGLPESSIAALSLDNNGNIWCSHKQGISTIQLANNKIRNFNSQIAYRGNEFSDGALYRDKINNLLYFGGSTGVNIFCPDSLRIDSIPPQVVLTDLQILNKTVEVGDTVNNRVVLDRPLYLRPELMLTYADKSVAFEFAALHFINPDGIKYAYKLEGFDENWIYTDANQRIASYSNLAPGNYTFKVKAANSDGVWNEEPTCLSIMVAPAWWASIWAYAAYTIFIIAVLIIVYAYLLRYDRLKNQLAYEELLLEKERDLHQSKLQFFTNISHEIKTPLSLILSPIQQLHVMLQPIPEAQSLLQTMQKNGARLLKTVNQLLDIRRLETGHEQLHIAEQDIVAFAKSILDNFQDLANENDIQLDFNSSVQELKVGFDADKLEKVLNNLLSNALKFTDKKGKVCLSITNQEQYVQLRVQDNGIGISAADLQGIFTPFKTSRHRNPTGSGLGLSYSKSLIELHDGTLGVSSRQTGADRGTTFTVSLPLVALQSARERTAEDLAIDTDLAESDGSDQLDLLPEAQTTSNKPIKLAEKPTLLLVEDNTEMREYLRRYFEKDYHLLEAADGLAGLELVRKHIPDLIISDVMMPEMDGISFCAAVKSDLATGHIPLILLTARSLPEYEKEGLTTGADDYIVKPFHIDLLGLKVKNQLLNRLRLQEKFRLKIAVTPTETEQQSPDEKLLQKVMRYVEEHIAEPDLRIDVVCESIGMSRAQIYRKMKALTGYSMADMIREVRLKRAQQLLRENKLNISEIAFKVGFSDANYFRKSFKAKFGQSPTDYAKQYNN